MTLSRFVWLQVLAWRRVAVIWHPFLCSSVQWTRSRSKLRATSPKLLLLLRRSQRTQEAHTTKYSRCMRPLTLIEGHHRIAACPRRTTTFWRLLDCGLWHFFCGPPKLRFFFKAISLFLSPLRRTGSKLLGAFRVREKTRGTVDSNDRNSYLGILGACLAVLLVYACIIITSW